jgi:anti-sigma factor RsiW
MITGTDTEGLDKLVDGELGEAARAALLRALDNTPGGWKRCALAFLEAQTWNAALRPPTPESAPAPVRSAGDTRGRRPPLVVRRLFAAAAMIAVAFGAGFASRGVDSSRPVAAGVAPGNAGVEHAVPGEREPDPLPRLARVPPPHTIPAVPERLRLQMERQGYQVSGDRKLIPVALGDGRRVAIPVDTVTYRYVGQRIQ